MIKTPPCVFISAGDPSGDIAGALLIRALRAIKPDISLCGLGGERMKSAGQDQVVEGRFLAAMGFFEVARRILFFRRVYHDTLALVARRRPQVAVFIDYPGMNLRLAEAVKKIGIPVVYYIAPQIWAWKEGRVETIRRVVDHLLVILPFEEQYFSSHGIKAEFVGHYMMEDIAPEYIAAPYDPDSRIIALLPGSRRQEIARMGATLCETAKLIGLNKYDIRIAAAERDGIYDQLLEKYPEFRDRIFYGRTRDIVKEAALVISSSGTATLETAVIGRPLVVIYKMNPLTYQIARRVVKLPYIALCNIVLGKGIAPELIQGAATPAGIAAVAGELLATSARRIKMAQEFSITPTLLRGAGTPRVAEIVAKYLA